MPRYLISYDLEKLNATAADYAKLITPLERMGAERVLKSQWVFTSTSSAQEICTYCWQFRSSDRDRFLVTAMAESSSANLLNPL